MGGSSQAIGNYRLFDKIGSGGMGSVYLGRLFASGGFRRIVAIKRMHPHLTSDADFVSAFLDEARLASRIHHPNVVAPLDVVAKDGEVFVVFEHILGLSLSLLFRRAIEQPETAGTEIGRTDLQDPSEGAHVPVRIAVGMMVSVLHGLHAAHVATGDDGAPLGLVHRDVSPQNILVPRDGSARLLDFGIAKASGRAHNTDEGVVKGKRGYMAPEHLLGSPCVASDLYSASVVIWELLAGRRLFPDETSLKERLRAAPVTPPSVIRGGADISAAVDAIVLRGLAYAPEQRFTSAREMAIALEETGIASAREIGDWVARIGKHDFDERARLVAAAESALDTSGPPTSAPDFEAASSIEPGPGETLIVIEPGATATAVVTSPMAVSSTGPGSVTDARGRSRFRVAIGAGIALATITVLAGAAIVSRQSATRAVTAVALPATTTSVVLAPDLPPPTPEVTSTSSVLASASVPSVRPRTPATPPRPAAAPPPAKKPCAPYVIDKDGRKQFNEACLR